MTQHQYNGMAIHEDLDSVVNQNVTGMQNELGDYTDTQNLPHVRLVSLVTKGEQEVIINETYTDINKVELLANFETLLTQIWEPDYDPDVMVGAGSTVKITE